MLPVIKLGEKLHIIPGTGSRLNYTFVTHVAEQLGNHRLLVYTPISRGNLVRLPEGADYQFLFYTQNELFQASGTVLEHCTINGLHYMKITYSDWQRIQRRTFFRLHCLLDFTFSNLADCSEDQPPQDLPVYKGVIKNLSGGGMFFVTEVKLAQNDEILCHLKLNDKSLTVKGKVIEAEAPLATESLYKYRAGFIELERQQEEQLVRFIFSLQLKMIKKLGEDDG